MYWQKQGLLIQKAPGAFSHASHPTATCIDGNEFLIAYCGRDKNQHSHIFLTKAIFHSGSITIKGESKLAMRPGLPGTFDSHGLLTCNFVKEEKNIFLYYCGWQNLLEGMWHCDTGRLLVNPVTLSLEREFDGPIMCRSKDIPLYAVATAVQYHSPNRWESWYNRGISWERKGEIWQPKYGIHYGTSKNGIDWECNKDLIIPFTDEFEHSFGRPTVLIHNDSYFMWFAARGADRNPKYRIGFAFSSNGKNWIRDDSLSGISFDSKDLSSWDSEAVAYPSVHLHEDTLYMLYNGNNYGQTGFGYATAHPHDLIRIKKTINKNRS
jgi:hypothetical protein